MKVYNAAIRTEKGNIYHGRRHEDAMRDMMWENDFPNGSEELGFVTDTGRFVDRTEAAQIAFDAGQTDTHEGSLKSHHLNAPTTNLELVEEELESVD
jgi:hypothetical protein